MFQASEEMDNICRARYKLNRDSGRYAARGTESYRLLLTKAVEDELYRKERSALSEYFLAGAELFVDVPAPLFDTVRSWSNW